MITEETVWQALNEVKDPEIPVVSLVEMGIVPDTAVLATEWRAQVVPFLEDSGLTLPKNDMPKLTDRNQHTEHLVDLLGEMQMVARLDPQAEW